MTLRELVDPAHTAIVTQELQGAVVGPDAGLRALADEARREALPNIARLLPAARSAGVPVVHCLVQRRADGLGSNHNAKLFAIGASGVAIEPGSQGATLLPEFGPEPTDLVLHRWHGLGPMGGTDLDAVLRNMGVRTIVAVGVSLDVEVAGLVLVAVAVTVAVGVADALRFATWPTVVPLEPLRLCPLADSQPVITTSATANVARAVASMPPATPSQLLPGLMAGASLCLPKARPAK